MKIVGQTSDAKYLFDTKNFTSLPNEMITITYSGPKTT